MNNKIKRLLSFVIAVMLIIQPTFSNTVYASEIEDLANDCGIYVVEFMKKFAAENK